MGSAAILGSLPTFAKSFKPSLYQQTFPHLPENATKLPSNGKHVLIIGAGLSGLMTACELLQRGFKVTLLEKGGQAGGKLCSWYDTSFAKSGQENDEPYSLEHATHGVWGFYNNFREFLGRHHIPLRQDRANRSFPVYSVVKPNGRVHDYGSFKNWPSISHLFGLTQIFLEYARKGKKFPMKHPLSLIAFNAHSPEEVQEVSEI